MASLTNPERHRLAARVDRFHSFPDDHISDTRSPARRDRDRILYSSAFRRLSGITQVVAPVEHHPTHSRLTHTLEVAQIGRSLAERLLGSPDDRARANDLGGLDPDVVEAACLAHDLGHPPFGHVAETTLDDLLKKILPDGFEGNAQSFRIVTRLAVRHPSIDGLNLTRATLNATQKYPWTRQTAGKKSRKWGAYSTEAELLAWAREGTSTGSDVQCLEAALMDWADDVAYAVHDVEDFFRAGLIPLDRLTTDEVERERFLGTQIPHVLEIRGFSESDLRTAFNDLMTLNVTVSPYRGSRFDRAGLRSFTSNLVDRYIRSVSVGTDLDLPLNIDPNAKFEVAILKRLTWHYVIESPALIAQRYGQRRLIQSLFSTLKEAAGNEDDWHIFPMFYQELLQGTGKDQRMRIVADLISSMSEQQVIEVHQRLTGLSLGSALDPILT